MSFGRVVANSGNTFETVPIISFLDNNFSVIRVDSFWSPNESHFGVPSWLGGLVSTVQNDTFYACATQGNHWFFNSGIIDTSAKVYVRAYDDQMNNLWEMVIGDSLHHVSVMRMERMPDGNLMLIGSEAGPESNYIFYPFIIEIDPFGRLVNSSTPIPFDENKVKIYPNPSRQHVYIDWKGNDPSTSFQIQIIDIQGRMIKEVVNINNGQPIDISSLQPGRYYIRCLGHDRRTIVKSLIKL
jgi:hypothetical protein